MPNIKYSKELLEPIVQNSKSISDVIRALGLVQRGGNYGTIKRNIVKFNIDCSHFIGQGWSKNLTKNNNKSVKNISEKNRKYNAQEHLIQDIYYKSEILHRLVKETNMPYVCVECGISTYYNNKPIKLHIDHINGNNKDNRLENLRYLCPNCHSQTDTYCSRK